MRIKELYIFPEKKARQLSMEHLSLIENEGIKGDAFCGNQARQVTIMSSEVLGKIQEARHQGICLKRYKYNILLEGVELSCLDIGDRLSLGEAEIEITEAKECKIFDCPLRSASCPISGLGVFAKVTKSGQISVGDIL